MNKTSIEWTNYSWPVVNGCTRISPGCGTGTGGGCYAERLSATRLRHNPKYAGLAEWRNGKPHWTGEVRLWEPDLLAPLKLRKPSRIFVCDMGDLFHDAVTDEMIDRVVAVIALAHRHTFQVLTKRAARMRGYFTSTGLYERVLRQADEVRDTKLGRRLRLGNVGVSNPSTMPLRNLWLGVSVEDQQRAEERVPLLLQTPAAVRFLSCEPLLEAVDLTRIPIDPSDPTLYRMNMLEGGGSETSTPWRINWVIVGGESGPGARPCDVAWIRSIVAQCKDAEAACFVKQLGADPIGLPAKTTDYRRINRGGYALDDRKGGDMAEWPADLRIREFPAVMR